MDHLRKEEKSAWKTMKNDKYLSQFLAANIQDESLDNTAVLSHSLTVSEQLAALTRGINLLEKELQCQIHNNYPELITQNLMIDNLEEKLINLQSDTQDLVTSINTIKDKLNEPFSAIKTQIRVLKRLHETSNILRCIIQIQQLTKIVQTRDSLEISALIKETDEFCVGVDLNGIHILKEHIQIIEKERQNIKQKAKSSLLEALRAENEAQAATDIQILLNLNALKEEVHNIVENTITFVEQETKLALDIQSLMNQTAEPEKVNKLKASGPGRITGSTFPGVNVAAFRTKLWSNWNNLLENTVYPKCVQIYILQYAISKYNESTLNPEKIRLNISEYNIITKFWNDVFDILSKNLIIAADDSSFIKQALEGDYPKLLKLHSNVSKKLQKLTNRIPIPSSNCFLTFFNHNRFADKFENAYLSRSLSRLIDGVHSMFSGDRLPNQKEIDSFIQLITNELNVTLVDETLCKTVVRNIGKAIRLFCLKSEQSVSADGSASQVIDILNVAQQTNINIANTLFYVKLQIQKAFSVSIKLSEHCKNEIAKEFSHVDELTKNILDPLKNSLTESIESIILTVHQENFNIDVSSETPPCSLYLRELQTFISRVHSNYLKPFNNQEIVQKCCVDMVLRCIDLFLTHISLVRPMSTGGRQKLLEDFNRIEAAIAPFCPDIKVLGEKYKILRSFRVLVACRSMQEVAEHELVGKPIPYSLTLMYLFSFAPPEIQSPHESCNWSIARFSQWLDNHKSERERLELISGTLQRYQQNVKQEKVEAHGTYSILVTLLDGAFKSL